MAVDGKGSCGGCLGGQPQGAAPPWHPPGDTADAEAGPLGAPHATRPGIAAPGKGTPCSLRAAP